MAEKSLDAAIERLAGQFARRDWGYLDVPAGDSGEKAYAWPGPAEDNIMICVHKGPDIEELFHRQDFFFFNFAYAGDYGALSYRRDNRITVHEGECYIGQPFVGYALSAHCDADIVIIGILIQKEAFFRAFLPSLSADAKLFRFFLEPQTNDRADEFIRLRFDDPAPVRTLLEMMVVEYADPKEDTQAVLQPLVLALLMLVARQYGLSAPASQDERLSDRIVRYVGEHPDTVTLGDVSRHFSYHPNYLSGLLRRETGKTFSQILLEQRMERAATLLRGTGLSVEEIAAMLGYGNSSNFYKAFKGFYHCSPRSFAAR